MLPAQGIGGLQSVMTDLVDGLSARGWDVDTQPLPFVTDWRGSAGWRSALAAAARHRLPDAHRLLGRVVAHDLGHVRDQSDILRDLERRIVDGDYSAIVACVDNAPVGLASLITRLTPRHALISLSALTSEVQRRHTLAAIGWTARRTSAVALHPDVLQPVDPTSVRSAIFASRTWRDAGIAAGLDARATSAIYFGVRVPSRLPPARPPQTPLHLLWAARLGPEKGLQLFLPAVALVRRVMPVQLTVVDASGPVTFRRAILRTIRDLGIEDVVRFEPPVPRDQLTDLLASHDLFLFHSMFAEPVAQMLLHAFAAGTVVVAQAARVPSIVKSSETAICFRGEQPDAVAAAIMQAARNETLRHRVRARAFALVQSEQSLDRTIADYHRLLTGIAGERVQARA